jgi:hypothetical protein
MSRLTDQTLFENQLYVCLQSWKTECIVNRCKKNNKVICMLCHSLQFVSCTVRHVFLVPRTSSGVDYVLVIELSANGLEPTFFFFGGGGGRGQQSAGSCACRVWSCAWVCCLWVCVCRYVVWDELCQDVHLCVVLCVHECTWCVCEWEREVCCVRWRVEKKEFV